MKCKLVILFLISITISAFAQNKKLEYRFINFDTESGLNTNKIQSVCQDSTGFIYVGTYDGFYQFDGLQFREIINPHTEYNFFHKVESLTYNEFHDEIILNTNYGLYSYNWAIDSISMLDSNNVQDVYLEKGSKRLWYTSIKNGYHVKQYNLESQKIEYQYRFDEFIHALCVHPKDEDKLFISRKNSLILFDINSKESESISIPSFGLESIYSDFISDIESLNEKVFLALKGGGVLEINLNNYSSEIHRYSDKIYSSKFNHIFEISKRDSSSFFITTGDRGAGKFDVKSKGFTFYKSDENDDTSIASGKARSVFKDRETNLWFAMEGGLSLLVDEMNHFSYSYYELPSGIDNREIREYSLLLFRDSLLFQAAFNANSLFVYDTNGNYISDNYSYPESWIQASSFVNYEDKFLLSFDKDFVYKIDPLLRKVEVVINRSNYPELDSKFSSIELISDSLFIKSSHRIFVFTVGDEFRLEGIEKLPEDPHLYGIIEQANSLYVWSKRGLFIRKAKNQYREIEDFNSKHLLVPSGPLFPSVRGENEILFGSSFQGIIIFNTETEESYKIDKKSGTKSNKITEITCDEKSNIWALSSSGLILYNAHSKRNNIFNQSNGLIDTDLIFKRILALENGKIAISIDGGLQILDLSEVQLDREGEKVIIYSINGQHLENNHFPFDIGQIEIAFSNFDYGNTTDVQYEYQINDEGWRKIKSAGVVSLNSLASGKYSFQLRATDMYARLSYSEVITFSIAYPWWRTWWFQTLIIVALLIFGITIFYFINKPKQKLKQVESEYEGLTKELENQVLRAQMNPHFLFNSLNSIRYYILNKETKKAADYLTKFSRLIRLILEHSSENVISLASELSMIKLYIELESIRFEDKFEFIQSIESYSDLESIYIPPMIIQPFLENAILHGINAKKTKATLKLAIIEEKEYLRFEISDDGIGRKKAAELKTKNSLNRKSMGMNITEKRLKMISERYPTFLKISDLNSDKEYPGTKVDIRISK